MFVKPLPGGQSVVKHCLTKSGKSSLTRSMNAIAAETWLDFGWSNFSSLVFSSSAVGSVVKSAESSAAKNWDAMAADSVGQRTVDSAPSYLRCC